MKQYVRLSVNAEGYYSGNTYFEEVFLPLEVWNEIKDKVDMIIYISDLDGKHSEVPATIEVEEMNEKDLVVYEPFKNENGEELFWYIDKYIDEKYGNEFLGKICREVENLSQVETFLITIRKGHKKEVLDLLNDYLLKVSD